jgi:hypothetical protein
MVNDSLVDCSVKQLIKNCRHVPTHHSLLDPRSNSSTKVYPLLQVNVMRSLVIRSVRTTPFVIIRLVVMFSLNDVGAA